MSRADATSRVRTAADAARHHVQRLVEQNRRRCQVTMATAGRPPVRSIGIVGAGLMGRAIAAASLDAGLRVCLHDADAATLAQAAQGVVTELVASLNVPSEPAGQCVRQRLRVTDRLDDVGGCDLVLESVTEKADAKRRVYAQLEPLLADDAVLATNTSTIPVERLAAGLQRPERLCAVHFFHPVARRPLVEIVRGPRTSSETLAAAVGYAQAMAKMALVVDDGPGFVVNRLLLPCLAEAVELLADGVTIERVEAVATAFGMAKGPLALVDEIGLDTVVAGGRVLWEAFPSRILISPLLIAMYKAGRFGVKSGAGFFNYAADESDGVEGRAPSRPRPEWDGLEGRAPSRPRYSDTRGHEGPWPSSPADPVALQKISQWSRAPQDLSDDDIRDRLLLPMVLEATRLLEERKVDHPGDIDLGVLFGLGFPAARGGLLYWADTLGPSEIVARLARLGAVGSRMHPTGLLGHMARTGERFYALHQAIVPPVSIGADPFFDQQTQSAE